MTQVGTYLNFLRKTEDVFGFSNSDFTGKSSGEILHFSNIPLTVEMLPLVQEISNPVMHLTLSI